MYLDSVERDAPGERFASVVGIVAPDLSSVDNGRPVLLPLQLHTELGREPPNQLLRGTKRGMLVTTREGGARIGAPQALGVDPFACEPDLLSAQCRRVAVRGRAWAETSQRGGLAPQQTD